MIDQKKIRSLLSGKVLALQARQYWSAFPLPKDADFLDKQTISEVRECQPRQYDKSFAPVSIVSDSLNPSNIPDETYDSIIAFCVFMEYEDILATLKAANRLLRNGGVLLLSIPDQNYLIDQNKDELSELYKNLVAIENEHGLLPIARDWATYRFVRLFYTIPDRAMGKLQLQYAGQFGNQSIIVMSQNGFIFWKTGQLVEYNSRVFVIDGKFARYVPDMDILKALSPSVDIKHLEENDALGLVEGKPVKMQDVDGIIKRGERMHAGLYR